MKQVIAITFLSFIPFLIHCQRINIIAGKIQDENLLPIKDAFIEIEDYTNCSLPALSNGDGYFRIDVTDCDVTTKNKLTIYCRHPQYIAKRFKDTRIDGTGLISYPELLILNMKEEKDTIGPKEKEDTIIIIKTITGWVMGYDGLPQNDVNLLLTDFISIEAVKTNKEGVFKFDVSNVHIQANDSLRFYCWKDKLKRRLENVILDSTGLINKPYPIVFGCVAGSSCDDGNDKTKVDRYDNDCNCISSIEIVTWKNYFNAHKFLELGILGGIGFREGHKVVLDITPSSIRTGRPHPDDVKNIPQCIEDQNIPDKYLIKPNKTEFEIPNRITIELLNLSVKGFANIGLRISPNNKESQEIKDKNLHRLNYILEGKGFEAFIYYSIKTKKNPVNPSIPIYATLPIFYFGDNKKLTFRTVIGTNLIRPKIKLEAIKGWDRHGELTPDVHIDIGKIKESEWFGGFDIEGTSMHYGFQVALVNNVFVTSDSFESFKLEDKLNLSYWLKASYVFNRKK